MPPPADDDAANRAGLAGRADAHAAVPLLNCLLREVAESLPAPGRPDGPRSPHF